MYRLISRSVSLCLMVSLLSCNFFPLANPISIFTRFFSLMQLAKTSGKLSQLSDAKLPYISLLTDPTFGGISASFGMLGDLNIAEPGALIGFAGPRVIKETIKKDLPPGFQRSEFILEHGFLDFIVNRKELKQKLNTVLSLFKN